MANKVNVFLKKPSRMVKREIEIEVERIRKEYDVPVVAKTIGYTEYQDLLNDAAADGDINNVNSAMELNLLIVENTLVSPNPHDKELQEAYDAKNARDFISNFLYTDEITEIAEKVLLESNSKADPIGDAKN